MPLIPRFFPLTTTTDMQSKSGKKLLLKTRKVTKRKLDRPVTENEKNPTPTNKVGDFGESEFSNILRRQREIFNKTFGGSENGMELEEREITPKSLLIPVTPKKRRGRPPNKTRKDVTQPSIPVPVLQQQKLSLIPSKEIVDTGTEDSGEDVLVGVTLPEDKLTPRGKRKAKCLDELESPSSKVQKKTHDSTDEDEISQKVKAYKKGTKDIKQSYVTCESKTDEGVKMKVFKCKICNKVSSAKADLMKHIRVHTGERPFKCKTCNASFVQITALRGHETIHTGKKPFDCDVCGKKFAIKDRLRLHMRVHTGEKPHKCKQCDLSFARRSQVSQHMRIHDTTKSKFTCEECGSTFSSYHTLKTHTNGHLGIKEFQCCACGKKFLRVEGMYKHIRTVHRGSRPYTCNICGKAFKGHLQQHMRLHRGIRPYTCHLCDAAFTQNSQLTVHLRIHTGERPYKCQVCGSSFAHSSACKIHMRSHTGEKPFICILCKNSFSQLPHLKKHMKCVHGADKPYMCTHCKDFFKTQADIDEHRRITHGIVRSPEEEAQETVEDATLACLRNRLAVLLYRISSEDRRSKFGFGSRLIDEVLKLSLQSSGHIPISDPSIARLEELRQNVLTLLRWTIPQETMEEYHKNKMTVDEVLEMLTS